MADIERSLVAITAALQDLGVHFALVGGLAVSVRAEPRFTRDADLAVSVASDEEAEAIAHSLLGRGYRVLAAVEQEATGRLSTVRLTSSADDRAAVTDLLFASTGIEPEIVGAAESLEVVPRLWVPVAAAGHLIAMKLLARDARRPNDDADLRALAEIATEGDWSMASLAVQLIEARGFERGRDLVGDLAGFRASLG